MPVYGFTSEADAAKVLRASNIVLKKHRFDLARLTAQGYEELDDPNVVHKCINYHETGIPGYGCAWIQGADQNTGFLKVTQSVDYGAQHNHVLLKKYGIPSQTEDGFQDAEYVTQWPALAAYHTDDGEPAAGQLWGPIVGSWLLHKNVGGFICVGVPAAPDSSVRPLIWVRPEPLIQVRGTSLQAFAKDNSGDILCPGGDGDDDEDLTIQARADFQDVPNNSYVLCFYVHHQWIAGISECP